MKNKTKNKGLENVICKIHGKTSAISFNAKADKNNVSFEIILCFRCWAIRQSKGLVNHSKK